MHCPLCELHGVYPEEFDEESFNFTQSRETLSIVRSRPERLEYLGLSDNQLQMGLHLQLMTP